MSKMVGYETIVKECRTEKVKTTIPALFGTILFGLFLELICNTLTTLFLIIPFFFILKNWRSFAIAWTTLPRDIRWARTAFNVKWLCYHVYRKNHTIPKLFEENVKNHPHHVAFFHENTKWTYSEINRLSNRVANYFKNNNYEKGDTVALVMENRPEYVCIWLGLSKIGVKTALINTNLRKMTLAHSIKTVEAKAVIYSTEFHSAVAEVTSEIGDVQLFKYSENFKTDSSEIDLFARLEESSDDGLPAEVASGKASDTLMYIYTSGTTGMPKAVIVKHSKFLFYVYVFNTRRVRRNDLVYSVLPIYHSLAGVIGVGASLLLGTPMVLKKKFSASNFWKDCIKYNCTVATYIGEVGRYLVSSPPGPEDKQHKLRMIYGAGLQAHLWDQFKNRFGIPIISEAYGQTEGNLGLYSNNKVGATGHMPIWMKKFQKIALVKCDNTTGNPIRSSNGFCVECGVNEAGLLISAIDDIYTFDGYTDKKATMDKTLENVFKPGDRYINMGDVFVQDELGYYYFKDRTGDTFRRRGENVTTFEVEIVLSKLVDFMSCVVYGVTIPHVDGKAGMAAILDPNNQLDLSKLTQGIREHLAPFARPVFIRVLKEIPQTGTFKPQKRDLQLEGYDVNRVKDNIYFYDGNDYQLLTDLLYNDIINGKIPF